MIHTTTAIVLRHQPYSNTSRIVHWLTPDWGRIATLIKGSQRPKSSFLGQFDLFYTCELVFYARESRDLFIAKECAPVNGRERFRHDWRACATASYLADLLHKTAPTHIPQPELFRLLEAAYDALETRSPSIPFMFWFELRLLDLLGLAPRLHHCLECGKKIEPSRQGCSFSDARGGVVCGGCLSKQGGAHGPNLPPDVLAMLHAWQNAKEPRTALVTHPTQAQQNRIAALLGHFLTYHLDLPLPSRAIALDMLKRQPGPENSARL